MTSRLVLAVLALACHRGPRPPDGDVAASLTAPTIAARAFDPASIKGKPTLVLFVSPTCPHCLKTLPVAAEAARAEGANAVAVFVVGKAENATGVLAQTHFTGPALIDDGTLRRRYAIDQVPTTLVLGPDGHARDEYIGEQDADCLRGAISRAR